MEGLIMDDRFKFQLIVDCVDYKHYSGYHFMRKVWDYIIDGRTSEAVAYSNQFCWFTLYSLSEELISEFDDSYHRLAWYARNGFSFDEYMAELVSSEAQVVLCLN
jgi:hypothetical protein